MSNPGTFKKGEKRPHQGKRGPGKATTNAREAIARLVDGNVERVQGWLDEIADADGPRAAFQCFMDLVEYHVPKLSRSEHTGANGGPIEITAKEQKDAAVAAALRADE